MKRNLHAFAGAISALLITIFIAATLYSELFGSLEMVKCVKNRIVFPGLFILIAFLALTVVLGKTMAGAHITGILATKLKRIKIITILVVFILVPCAIALRSLSLQDSFGTSFIILQLIELLAGCINLSLIALNIKDGKSLSHNRKTMTKSPT